MTGILRDHRAQLGRGIMRGRVTEARNAGAVRIDSTGILPSHRAPLASESLRDHINRRRSRIVRDHRTQLLIAVAREFDVTGILRDHWVQLGRENMRDPITDISGAARIDNIRMLPSHRAPRASGILRDHLTRLRPRIMRDHGTQLIAVALELDVTGILSDHPAQLGRGIFSDHGSQHCIGGARSRPIQWSPSFMPPSSPAATRDEPNAGGSVISVPPLPSDAKSSVPLRLTNVRLAARLPSVTVRRPVEALYDCAK